METGQHGNDAEEGAEQGEKWVLVVCLFDVCLSAFYRKIKIMRVKKKCQIV